MPIPEFIVELRRRVGHAPLWLLGITAVVIRDGQVLLVQRSDNHAWTPVTGIVEREVLEEAGVHVTARRLAWVHVTRPVVHANGDQAQYLDHVFRMEWTGGEPLAADDESLQARWFDPSEMPTMSTDMCRRIEHAIEANLSAPTVFERSSP